MNQSIVTLASGKLRGFSRSGVAAFLGIPYAASPVHERRFAAPQPPPAWPGIRDASSAGPAMPQGPSRLELVMGERHPDWAEDGSLTLNVWTPSQALSDDSPRAVLLWFHGGGFSSGSGGWDWYHGAHLAELGNMVVVTANYRLGPLGYLWLPEIGAENLGSQDQAAALNWVVENIGYFGGDPKKITVGGQSAGAFSSFQLAAQPASRGMIKRVIVQSSPWGLEPQDPELAASHARKYLGLLGVEERANPAAQLRQLPVERLLVGYAELARAVAGPGSVAPPMYPVAGGPGTAQNWRQTVDSGLLDGIDILLGSTRHEMTAFFAFNPQIQGLDQAAGRAFLESIYGEKAVELYRQHETRLPQAKPAEIVTAVQTEQVFQRGAVELAHRHTERGNRSYLYQWDYLPEPDPASLGATHCGELPFLFGNFDSFQDSPMLGEVPERRTALWQSFGGALANFVSRGVPGGDPEWLPYNARTRNEPQHFS
ncbi:carboxylesterase [Psychromicrobium lacuslunae]|uniref:Carboxylic ester hydrolase n=1 Tax=Psychromicrobium lacuslunae TaxID=1618207 RepID=A0A0D4C3B1_9MICC|nr:carboxylesterase [Psychromicrobium lacuslunae]